MSVVLIFHLGGVLVKMGTIEKKIEKEGKEVQIRQPSTGDPISDNTPPIWHCCCSCLMMTAEEGNRNRWRKIRGLGRDLEHLQGGTVNYNFTLF